LSDGTYSNCTIIVTDSDGNASNTLTITSFIVDTTTTTTDTTAPTVTSVSTTADNQSSVSITDNITVTFSEAMDTTYVTTSTSDTNCAGTIRVSSDNFSTCVKMSSSPASSNSNKTFTLDPYDNLTAGTTYKTRITTGVKDTAGNALSSQYETSSGFTPPDLTAPTVTSVSTTADNQSSIAITDNITVSFSEAMDNTSITTNTDDSSCYGTLRVSSDNFSSCVQMASSPSSSNSDMTFTLDPSDNLTVGTTYLTRVTTGVKDASGNAMSSQYDNSNGFTTFSFRPQTKAELETAVDLWTCSYESTSCDNNLALATYGEINTWDVSLITSMTNLFEDKTTFNDNISAWDVSSVTTMQRMFQNAWVFNQDISSWNVSNVTNMLRAFAGAYDFNQDIGSWDVSSVTNMENMIYIAKDFNQDISDWDVSNVTNMSWMFASTDNFTQDISGWYVSYCNRYQSRFIRLGYI
jgi:surface protein